MAEFKPLVREKEGFEKRYRKKLTAYFEKKTDYPVPGANVQLKKIYFDSFFTFVKRLVETLVEHINRVVNQNTEFEDQNSFEKKANLEDLD